MSKELYDKIRRVLELAEGVIVLQEEKQHWVVKSRVITWGELRDEIQGALKAWDNENTKAEEMSRIAAGPPVTK